MAPAAPSRESLQRLQAYPRTLVELDRVRGPAVAGTLRKAGGELIAPPLELWRLPSWTAQRLLPRLLRRGLVRSVTPDVPLGTDPDHAAGFLSDFTATGFVSDFTDPLSSSEWWVLARRRRSLDAAGAGKASDDDRLRRRPLT